LALLGSYRGFYILNWIVRFADKEERHFDPVSVIFGIIQTALYVDFAWVYYSRQRVKLRAGGLVDSDDLERGWLVGRLAGKRVSRDGDEDDDIAGQEDGVIGGRKWGPRGISVSADEGLFDDAGEDARPLSDPSAFEDELTDDEAPPPATGSAKGKSVDKPSSPWADDEEESTSK
jgi:ER lumen protein retaining receptor